jgi:hypothetical protein
MAHLLYAKVLFAIFEALQIRFLAAIVKRVPMDLGSIVYFRQASSLLLVYFVPG